MPKIQMIVDVPDEEVEYTLRYMELTYDMRWAEVVKDMELVSLVVLD